MSKLIQISVDVELLERWKRIDAIHNDESTDDHTRCPNCLGQVFFCDCTERLADEVLQSIKNDEPVEETSSMTLDNRFEQLELDFSEGKEA